MRPSIRSQDVVNAARSRPGEVTYASAGNGGSAHLAAALVEALSKTRMTHVPFRGNAPALTEVMAGRVSFMFYPMVGIADHVAQKRLKVLASSTERRHPDYPNAPTMAESGFPGFEQYTQGLGVVAAAGTPTPIVGRLNEAVRASLAKAETREKFRAARRHHRGRQHARAFPQLARGRPRPLGARHQGRRRQGRMSP